MSSMMRHVLDSKHKAQLRVPSVREVETLKDAQTTLTTVRASRTSDSLPRRPFISSLLAHAYLSQAKHSCNPFQNKIDWCCKPHHLSAHLKLQSISYAGLAWSMPIFLFTSLLVSFRPQVFTLEDHESLLQELWVAMSHASCPPGSDGYEDPMLCYETVSEAWCLFGFQRDDPVNTRSLSHLTSAARSPIDA